MLDKDKLLPGERMNDSGKFARRETKKPDLQERQESKRRIHPPSSGQSPPKAPEPPAAALEQAHASPFHSPFSLMLLHRKLLFSIPHQSACCTPVPFLVITQCTSCCADGFLIFFLPACKKRMQSVTGATHTLESGTIIKFKKYHLEVAVHDITDAKKRH